MSRIYPWLLVGGVVLAVGSGFQVLHDTGDYSAALGWWVAALMFAGMAVEVYADD